MRKRSSEKKSASLVDVAAKVVETVTEIVSDPAPMHALPPADFVPETPSGTAAAGAPAAGPIAARRGEIARKAAAARRGKKKGTP